MIKVSFIDEFAVYACTPFSYEKKVYDVWTADVGSMSQENLDKPLITRDENTKLIKVNFDQQVLTWVTLFSFGFVNYLISS